MESREGRWTTPNVHLFDVGTSDMTYLSGVLRRRRDEYYAVRDGSTDNTGMTREK